MGIYKSKMEIPGKPLEEYEDRSLIMAEGKTGFITGGTGFLGKVLLEKVLRLTPNYKRIYLLVRVKKGKSPDDRLKDLFKNPLFDLLRKEQGEEVFKKVVAIPGDCAEIDLGISYEDRQILIEEVNYLYHGAATVRFDETLKKSILLNTRGTKYIIELARQMKQLLVAAHISTAYCHIREKVLYEKLYDPPANPHKVIQTMEWLDDEVIDSITEKILGDYPNAYAFSKALAEGLVNEVIEELPFIILRPSIVIPIWKDPLPGWTDNINGPIGLMLATGKGILRTMYINSNNYADFLPADIAINGILCASADYIINNKIRKVYNLTSSSEYKITWEEIIEIGRDVLNYMPLNNVVWYPGGSMKSSRFINSICVFLFHVVPAYFLDFLILIFGYKPIVVKIQGRITKGFEMFDYYANRQWIFNNDASLAARELQTPLEAAKYPVHGHGIDYLQYFISATHCARLYLLHEPDSTIPAAKRHMKIMYCVDKFCKTMFFIGLFYFLYYKVLLPIFSE